MEWWLQEVLVFYHFLAGRQLPLGVLSHNQRSYRTSVPGCFLSRWLNQLFFDFFFQNALLVKDLPAAQEAPVGVQQVLSQHHRCWSIRARWFFFLKKISVSKKKIKENSFSHRREKKNVFLNDDEPRKKFLSRRKTSSLSSANFFCNLYFLDSFHFSSIRTSVIVTVILVAVSLIRFLINWEC